MMKAKIMGIDGKAGKEVSLPEQFSEEFRPDLIKKAVLVQQSHNVQPYGTKPTAGTRQSAMLSKRRKAYKTVYGRGGTRTPKKVMTRRGLHMYYVGAFAPNTVGGRVSHPPQAVKIYDLKINVKERRKALRSAIAATMDAGRVSKRGHRAPSMVVEGKFEDIKKTKDVENLFSTIGLQKELERVGVKKVRAGKGKNRGHPYKKKKGPLLVVSKDCPLSKAAKNVAGVDVCNVKDLNVELLAPGTDAGRLTLWTDKALEIMEKEKLFY